MAGLVEDAIFDAGLISSDYDPDYDLKGLKILAGANGFIPHFLNSTSLECAGLRASSKATAAKKPAELRLGLVLFRAQHERTSLEQTQKTNA